MKKILLFFIACFFMNGIQAMEEKLPDYYIVLGVNYNATERQIKRVYIKVSLKYHPDRWVNKPDDEKQAAEERFKEISNAKEVLSDPEKRMDYDIEFFLDEENSIRLQAVRGFLLVPFVRYGKGEPSDQIKEQIKKFFKTLEVVKKSFLGTKLKINSIEKLINEIGLLLNGLEGLINKQPLSPELKKIIDQSKKDFDEQIKKLDKENNLQEKYTILDQITKKFMKGSYTIELYAQYFDQTIRDIFVDRAVKLVKLLMKQVKRDKNNIEENQRKAKESEFEKERYESLVQEFQDQVKENQENIENIHKNLSLSQERWGVNFPLSPLILNELDGLKAKDELLLAIEQGDVGKVKKLIPVVKKTFGTIDIRDDEGRTPLMIATSKGKNDVIELLLNAGANINAIDANPEKKVSALWRAYTYKKPDTFNLLLKKGADPNIFFGAKPPHNSLLISIINNSKSDSPNDVYLQEILKYSVNLNYKNKDNQTALDIAKKLGFKEIVALLEQKMKIKRPPTPKPKPTPPPKKPSADLSGLFSDLRKLQSTLGKLSKQLGQLSK